MSLLCHRCGAILQPGEGSFYVVRIEAFADPTPPEIPAEDPEVLAREIDDLIAQLAQLSERELMDQVYRRLTVLLCRRCYATWIEDPTG